MKILKIFGAVVAFHAVVFILIFANPGCSSTKNPVAAAPDPTPTPSPMVSLPSSAGNSSPIFPAPVSTADFSGSGTISFDPNAPAISAPARYSPTRPGTPVAGALEAKPVADVIPATAYTVASGDNLWNLAKKNHLRVSELAAANNLHTDAKLKPGQKLLIPGKSTGETAAAAAVPMHRVKAGETLASIAKQAGTTSTALKQLNGLKSDSVRFGQELKLPASAPVDAAGGALADVAASAKNVAGSVTHVVKPGETLSSIAQKYQVKYSEIATANSITDPSKVRAGMTLVIPGWQAPKSAKAGDPGAKSKGEAQSVPMIGARAGAGGQTRHRCPGH